MPRNGATTSASWRAAACAWLAMACTALVAVSAVAQLPNYPEVRSDEMRAHFINVGQGSAVLLEFKCGTALIDTGGETHDGGFSSTTVLTKYLDSYFARRPALNKKIDLLILTHAHIDHTRGAPAIFERYDVGALVDNGLEKGSGGRQQKMAHARVKASSGDIRYFAARERDITSPDGVTDKALQGIRCGTGATSPAFKVLWGSLDKAGRTTEVFENGNAHSVVMRLDFGKASFLFPGDLEDDVQGEMTSFFAEGCTSCPLNVDVLHVSHHGSHNGTTIGLMKASTPKMAVITCGPWNRREQWTAYQYGHPRVDAVNQLLTGEGHVSERRSPKRSVKIANRAAGSTRKPGSPASQFSTVEMEQAIYATGWDGTVVITAKANGTLTTDIEE